jgi:hypothetical protein
MANPYTVGWGLRPARMQPGSGAASLQLEDVKIAYNNSNSFGQGDLVIRLSTGYIDKYVAGGSHVLGVFWGCKYFNPSIGRTDWFKAWLAPAGLASTTIVEAWIYSDPLMAYEILGDNTRAIAQGDVGNNADLTLPGAPNTTTGVSTAQLLTGTIGSTSTFPLRILDLAQLPNVSNSLINNVAIVKLNTSEHLAAGGI